ncbi:PTS fructose transporter subunit IIB [Natrinema salaciae]|uniref:PTS system, fructose-specific IIB component n=1 Tax=Natrinema salaciae TaxID=1186196 RepID=A0A1H9NJ33_9EURY|nr:PTS fructose transporter subunit IIB [Natrinema salaciae]SER35901.1 PTS system, fructose-specific IIB component [Natrinema salaciae]
MKLVAVTSCPTGIAHSQMAAENLETTAEAAGHDIEVEVQGAMGAENELSDSDIAAADAVIIAADTSVSRGRFEEKPLVKGTVKDAVNDPEGLIDTAAQRADAGETGVTGASDGARAETAASHTRESESDSDTDSANEAHPEQLGGDPSKGLFARLKRLFS